MRPRPIRPRRFLAVWILTACTAACGSNEYAAPPPPAVTTQHPVVRDVTRYVEYTGTAEAIESVEVRARVTGFLRSMHFDPGDRVKKGQLLLVIDPEPFEIELAAARANLAANTAELDLAQTEYDRARLMFEKKAISELNLIQAGAKRDQARAAAQSSKTKIHTAELNIEWAHVKAPITGRVGRHRVDVGNLVGAEGTTLLTNMIRYSPVYVYFHMSELDLLALQRMSLQQREVRDANYDDREKTAVQVGQADDEGYPHEGVIDFTGLQVDPGTGTLEIRGVLPNEGALDEIVLPGTFLRVRVPIGEQKDALLITERALGSDQSGRFVLVVNNEGVVEQRVVEVGPIIDNLRLIEKGLGPEDQVIVNGLQRARPGAPVTATLDDGKEKATALVETSTHDAEPAATGEK
ncbi:MAG: efflux RND transporter periplasmic adaptor subunit [Deltaproteobacteria bacterium]|nr:efflux RND transporter periplasmic adaptor subunit [Deltaproteobacteria bacterium]